MNLAELTAHVEEQEKKGREWVTISTADARELIRGYQSFSYTAVHDTPDISGLIRFWPFPQPRENP